MNAQESLIEYPDEYRGPMTKWVVATPLPFQFAGHDRCGDCGKRFWFGGRCGRYEAHWQLEHASSDSPTLAEMVVRRGD